MSCRSVAVVCNPVLVDYQAPAAVVFISVLLWVVTFAAVVSSSVLLRFVTPVAVVFSSVLLRFVTPVAVVFSSVLIRFVTPVAVVSSSVMISFFCSRCCCVQSYMAWIFAPAEVVSSLVFLLLLLLKWVGALSSLVLLQELFFLLSLCPFLACCFEFVLRLLLSPALSCKELLFPTLCS